MQKILLVALVIILGTVLVVACNNDPTETVVPPTVVVTEDPTDLPPTDTPVPEKPACLDGLSFGGPATVVAVDDVDTIQIETPSGIERIDFVGVNGWSDEKLEEAGEDFLKELLPVGTSLELALDPVIQEHNGKPAYYVYFGETFVNTEILSENHARPRDGIVDQLVCGEYFKEIYGEE